jgi:hypothetical protein
LLIGVSGCSHLPTSSSLPPAHTKGRYEEQTVNLSAVWCWQTNEMCHANVSVSHIPSFQSS